MAKKKNEVSILRSSAAEYLTFLTATGQSDVNAIYADENVWLSQKMLALLYNVEVNTINYHLQKAFKTGELDGNSVIRIFRITASDGKEYDTKHYNLKAIISARTSIDYDPKANLTRLFFARVQNQLHWAIHGETAAEVIRNRAGSEKKHMGLTTWKDAPDGKMQQFDVIVAKNYLTEKELSAMSRIVSAYLDLAENMALDNVPMTMEDWAKQFEGVLRLSKKEILTNAGKISKDVAKRHALAEFEKYRVKQDRLFENDFDRFLNEGGVEHE